MMKMIFAALAALMIAPPVAAQTALRDVAYVRDSIIHVGMAYELSEKCGSLRARTLRGVNFLYSLKRHARDLGYSNAQIDAYIDNRDEKRRLEGIARAQLAALGVVEGNEGTYCAVGQSQIAAGTQVGQLLR